MNPQEEVLHQLEGLIEKGRQVVASYRGTESYLSGRESKLPETEIRALLVAAAAAVERVSGRDSEFYRSLPDRPGNQTLWGQPQYAEAALATLSALHDSVSSGYLGSLERRIRANVEDDFLVQAEELISGKYHAGAMVLIAAVLEDRLRTLCFGRGIQPKGSKLSIYNDALRDVEYDQPTWRRIQVVGDLRNPIAHGERHKAKKVAVVEVEDALQFVQRFLAEHPG